MDVRIVTVSDVYDSLTSLRPYRTALTRDQSLKIMKEEVERGWWDARVFDTFTSYLTEFRKDGFHLEV